MYQTGEQVRLVINPEIQGVIIDSFNSNEGLTTYKVFHSAGNIRDYFEEQLEPVASPGSSEEQLMEQSAFFYRYALKKLSIRFQTTPLSLNAGKIKFIPYQFRPLRKILQAEEPRILIADEVGVGKTIETGIIIKEFEQRESIERILIVCPKELTTKWYREMRDKFDETFCFLDTATFNYCIDEFDRDGEWPPAYSKCIIGLEMLRRAENLEKLAGVAAELSFDMLVVDEAHHIINRDKNSYKVASILCDASDIVVFLSATPIQLKSRDLQALLGLLVP